MNHFLSTTVNSKPETLTEKAVARRGEVSAELALYFVVEAQNKTECGELVVKFVGLLHSRWHRHISTKDPLKGRCAVASH